MSETREMTPEQAKLQAEVLALATQHYKRDHFLVSLSSRKETYELGFLAGFGIGGFLAAQHLSQSAARVENAEPAVEGEREVVEVPRVDDSGSAEPSRIIAPYEYR